jgi:hypothetical protein
MSMRNAVRQRVAVNDFRYSHNTNSAHFSSYCNISSIKNKNMKDKLCFQFWIIKDFPRDKIYRNQNILTAFKNSKFNDF